MPADSDTAVREQPALPAKFRAVMLGVVVGDALGAPFEGGLGAERARLEKLVAGDGPLPYTDDTAMTMDVAASLVECGGFDGARMAERMARSYSREPWRGYGGTPPRIFALHQEGVAWDEASRRAFGGEGSLGNGAAMRVAPAGLVCFDDLDRARSLAERIALITHAHPLGIGGAVLQATAVALLVREESGHPVDPSVLLETLRRTLSLPFYTDALARIENLLPDARPRQVVVELGQGIEAHRSVPTALYCFLRHVDSFRDAVSYAISLGGDTDTIASMTGALAGAALGEDAIPTEWIDAVEGVDRMRTLGDELFALATGPGVTSGDP